VLAGEHASRLPTWQEGAVVSATTQSPAFIRRRCKHEKVFCCRFCAADRASRLRATARSGRQRHGRPGDYSFQGGEAVFTHVCQECHMATPKAQWARARVIRRWPMIPNWPNPAIHRRDPAWPKSDAALGRAVVRPADRRCGHLHPRPFRQQFKGAVTAADIKSQR